jgi:hypothetical protein
MMIPSNNFINFSLKLSNLLHPKLSNYHHINLEYSKSPQIQPFISFSLNSAELTACFLLLTVAQSFLLIPGFIHISMPFIPPTPHPLTVSPIYRIISATFIVHYTESYMQKNVQRD